MRSKPEIIKDDDYINDLYTEMEGSKRELIRVVHLSDVHVDFRYTVGTEIDCGNYLCCRPESGYPSDPDRQAKPWGSYKCDLPP